MAQPYRNTDDGSWAPVAITLTVLVVALVLGYFLWNVANQNADQPHPTTTVSGPPPASASTFRKMDDDLAKMHTVAEQLAKLEAQKPELEKQLKLLDQASADVDVADRKKTAAEQERVEAMARVKAASTAIERLAKQAGVAAPTKADWQRAEKNAVTKHPN